ncbi:MAG: AAA family ATPase [Bacteroidia bacterium]|nr:AAA family ATPase [Bacteroidia bacterium]MCZ2249674.1 AAA family ATPase [Bacteroidia bacterium]
MVIFLLGFMGSGKTTYGKKLAKSLTYNFIDLDMAIEKEENASIAFIFETKGEEYFRTIEHQKLKSLLTLKNTVIACGGGTPCFFNNIDLMNKYGLTVYLELKVDIIYSRLKQNKEQRPLIKQLKEDDLHSFIRNELDKRKADYLKSALVVDGLNLKIKNLTEKIKNFMIA